MAVRVVEGLIGKPELDQRINQTQVARSTTAISAGVNSASFQQAIAKAVTNTDAVVSAVRAFRAHGLSEPLKDSKQAQKTADDIADKIRGDKNGEASGAHAHRLRTDIFQQSCARSMVCSCLGDRIPQIEAR